MCGASSHLLDEYYSNLAWSLFFFLNTVILSVSRFSDFIFPNFTLGLTVHIAESDEHLTVSFVTTSSVGLYAGFCWCSRKLEGYHNCFSWNPGI
jgi:hypothetical protein